MAYFFERVALLEIQVLRRAVDGIHRLRATGPRRRRAVLEGLRGRRGRGSTPETQLVLPTAQDVDDGELDESSEDEDQAGGHPQVDGFDVRHSVDGRFNINR